MTQHNNNLSLHQKGKDAALLQSQLTTLGYTIAASEIHSESFGESTLQAVIQFQQGEGLPVTGRVDDATAQAIMSRFEADKTVIRPTSLPIHPQTTQGEQVVDGDPVTDSPIGVGSGGIDTPPSTVTGVNVHTPQANDRSTDPTHLIREERGG